MTADSESRPPSTRWTYALCVGFLVVVLLNLGGVDLDLLIFLAIPCLLFAALFHTGRLRWSAQSPRTFQARPVLACISAVVGGLLLVGQTASVRFRMKQRHYEAVAVAIASGRYGLPASGVDAFGRSNLRLKPADSSLALNVFPILARTKIAGVNFVTVSHGFAGHGGYLRTFDPKLDSDIAAGHPPSGWNSCRALTPHWYVCGN